MVYTKYKDPWSESDILTAKALNYIETQWDEIKEDADAHNHDTRYYTKTSADITFFSTSFYTGFDADLLDGNHLSNIVANVLPIGSILVWSGTDATIPAGWHICDGGTYGEYATPDLRDRFVAGAGNTYDPNDALGVATYNGTITPEGTPTIGDHVLTASEIPSHTHSYTEYYAPLSGAANYQAYPFAGSYLSLASRSTSVAVQTTGDGSHGHTGSSASFNTIDPRPKYYSLYYIMKYS